MNNVSESAHIDAARRFRQLYARHNKARDLIQLGAYQPGHDPELDAAVRLNPQMRNLLQQDMHKPASMNQSLRELRELTGT
jgi:flagellum-specific ATP synthase